MFEHHENIEYSWEWSLCHSWKWQQLVHLEEVSKAVGSHALHWLIGIPVVHWFTTGSRVAIHIYIILYNQQLINQILEKVHLGNKLHVVSMSCCKFSSTKVESDVLNFAGRGMPWGCSQCWGELGSAKWQPSSANILFCQCPKKKHGGT